MMKINKMNIVKIAAAVFVLCTAVAVSGCSNLFEKFVNEDGTDKTGNDSVSGSSTNTDINKGLVVIKATAPAYNQITFVDGTTDYVVTDNLESADNSVEFRCFPDDVNAVVSWSAQQIKEYKNVGDSTPVALATPVDVSISQSSSDRYAFSKIPYGVTEVYATVFADDAQYNTTYKITLTLPKTENTVAQLRSITLTPVSTNGYTTTTPGISFDPATNEYQYLTVDEDADNLTFSSVVPEGVKITDVTYVHKDGSTDTEASPYTILLDGGVTSVLVTAEDDEGNSRTYVIYVKKPKDNDTSLQSLTYTVTPSAATSYGIVTPGAISPDADAMSASYTITGSADNRADLQSLTFTAVQTHKYATLAYAVADTCPAESNSSWTVLSSKSAQSSTSPVTETVNFASDDATGKTELSHTLWIKVVSKEYKHSDGNTYGDIKYHSVKITKPADKNTYLTSAVIVKTYENGKTETLLNNVPANAVVGNTVGQGTTAYAVTTYADMIDFYVRTLDKDASVTYTAQAVENFTDETITENTSETSFAGRQTDASASDVADASYNNSSYTYKKITIGKVADSASSTDDLPDGRTQVVIYVNGSAKYIYNITKPDSSIASISGLGTGSGSGTSREPYTFYYYVTDSTKTSYDFTLTASYANSALTVTDCKNTEDADGGAVTNSNGVRYYLSEADTTGTAGPKYSLKVGECESYTSSGDIQTLPEGTTAVNFNVANGTSAIAWYRIIIIKYADSESRLTSLTVGGKTVTGFVYNSVSSENDYTNASRETGTCTVEASALSQNAAVAVSAKYSQSEITEFDDSSWSSAQTVDAASSSGGDTQNVSCVYTASEAGWYLITITVTPKSGSSRVYKIIQPVALSSDSTLSSFSARQYQKDAAGDYYTILGTEFTSGTVSYEKQTDWTNHGDIVIGTAASSSYAAVALSSVMFDGTDKTSSCTKTESSGSVSTVTIPYSVYKDYAGKSVVAAYAVTAQNGTKSTYSLTIKISDVEAVTVTEKNVDAAGYSYYYNADYTHIMAYRFGSARIGSSPYTSANGYGGIDIIASKDKGTNWGACSYALSGFIYIVNVGGTNYKVKLIAPDTPVTVTDGVTLTVSPSLQYNSVETAAEATPYVTLKHTVTNTTGKTVKLGVMIDTLVNTVADAKASSADSVTITPTTTGFTITNAGYTFAMYLNNAYGVNDVNTFWYGEYGNDDTCMFNSAAAEEKTKPSDSAVSFSWNLGTESSCTRSILMSLE